MDDGGVGVEVMENKKLRRVKRMKRREGWGFVLKRRAKRFGKSG